MIKHLLFSEILAAPGTALLARDLDAELAEGTITHSQYQCLCVERDFVRAYRGRIERTYPAVQFERLPDEGLL